MAGPGWGLIAVFLAFHIVGGLVGLPIVFLSIVLSRQMRRHPTLLNFCATWTIASLVYTLLLFSGQEGREHPPFGLCLAQAAMVNGAFPMTSVAGLALVVHIWHGLGPFRPWSQFGLASHDIKIVRLTALLIAPYLVFLAFCVAGAVVGHSNPNKLRDSSAFFYCTLDSGAFNIIVPAFTTTAMVLILCFEVSICVKISQNSYIRAGINRSGSSLFLLRLAGFTIYAIIALVATSLFLRDSTNFAPYIIQATLPCAVLIFLGTQKEVLESWKHWTQSIRGRKRTISSKGEGLSSTAALIPLNRHNATSSFAAVATPKLHDIPLEHRVGDFSSDVLQSALPMTVELPRRPERPLHTGLSGLEDAVFTIAPTRPQPTRAGPTTNPVEQQRPYNSRAYNTYRTNLNGSFGIEEDPAVVIAAQKQTIERLLEEAGYTSRALEKLKNVEKTFYRTENLLIAERRTAAQLREYINQIELDLKSQTNLANEFLIVNKETEVKYKMQEDELKHYKRENSALSDALQHSVRNEMQWKERHDKLKGEHTSLSEEVVNLRSERDILLDIWSTLESPVDWDLPKGKSRRDKKHHGLPDVLQQLRQRASAPAPRGYSVANVRMTRRQTETGGTLRSGGVAPDLLDRLRPRMLQLSGKMELSEKVAGLEELVREQTAIIEDLQASLGEVGRGGFRHQSESNWSIPNSIHSSMITDKSDT